MLLPGQVTFVGILLTRCIIDTEKLLFKTIEIREYWHKSCPRLQDHSLVCREVPLSFQKNLAVLLELLCLRWLETSSQGLAHRFDNSIYHPQDMILIRDNTGMRKLLAYRKTIRIPEVHCDSLNNFRTF